MLNCENSNKHRNENSNIYNNKSESDYNDSIYKIASLKQNEFDKSINGLPEKVDKFVLFNILNSESYQSFINDNKFPKEFFVINLIYPGYDDDGEKDCELKREFNTENLEEYMPGPKEVNNSQTIKIVERFIKEENNNKSYYKWKEITSPVLHSPSLNKEHKISMEEYASTVVKRIRNIRRKTNYEKYEENYKNSSINFDNGLPEKVNKFVSFNILNSEAYKSFMHDNEYPKEFFVINLIYRGYHDDGKKDFELRREFNTENLEEYMPGPEKVKNGQMIKIVEKFIKEKNNNKSYYKWKQITSAVHSPSLNEQYIISMEAFASRVVKRITLIRSKTNYEKHEENYKNPSINPSINFDDVVNTATGIGGTLLDMLFSGLN